MNDGNSESAAAIHSRSAQGRNPVGGDELERTKRDLLQAEVRLAKARVTVVTAEIDVEMFNARLKTLVK